jgi:O-antigen/teichoic acid export membrane protein
MRHYRLTSSGAKLIFRAVVGMSAAQLVNALSALLRVPILTRELGGQGYGSLVLLTAVLPWQLVMASGLRYSVRVMSVEAQSRDAVYKPSDVLQAHLLLARRQAIVWLALGLPTAVGIALLCPGFVAPHGNRADALAALCLVLVLGCTGLSGVARTGQLEAQGRAPLVNTLGAASGLAGLGATLALSAVHARYFLFVGAAAAAVVAPYWCAMLFTRGAYGATSEPRLQGFARRYSRRYGIASAATLLSNGGDPFIVAALLGAGSVASYSLAARLAIMVTVVPTAVGPILWRRQAARRALAQGQIPEATAALGRQLRVGMIAGSLAAAAFVWVGPTLADVLGQGQIQAPWALYAAFAMLGIFQYLQAPLIAALSGSRGSLLLTRANVLSSLVSIALSAPMILAVGVSGAPWASVIAAFGVVSWWLRSVHRDGEILQGTILEGDRRTV